MSRPLLVSLFLFLGLLSSPARAQTLLGVYHGNQGWDMPAVAAMERWQGKRHAVLTLFTGWSETSTRLLFDHQLPAIWAHGSVPLVSWEPHFGAATPADVEARIAAGEHDALIDQWAARLRDFLAGPDGQLGSADDRRAYLRLGHEMNGNWYPWSANGEGETPADYVAMWRRVHQRIAATGITSDQLQWLWCVGASDHGRWQVEEYYPGDAYVDWLGLDGYNWDDSQSWSSTRSPAQIFDPMLQRLRAFSDAPVGIIETAAGTQSAEGVAGKSAWIEALFDYVESRDIRMISWFNQDKETDWQIYAGTGGDEQHEGVNAYRVYRERVASEHYLGGDESNPRWLSDAAFRGDFDGDASAQPGVLELPLLPAELSLQQIAGWDGGYCASARWQPGDDVRDWTVTLAANGALLSAWDTRVTLDGANFQFRPQPWNVNAPAGQTTAFGFCASGKLPSRGQIESPPLKREVTGQFGAVQVQQRISSLWGGGFCADIVLRNGSAEEAGWASLQTSLGEAKLTSHWTATPRDDLAGGLEWQPVSWNRTIAPGGSRSFGFCASGSANIGVTGLALQP